MIQLAQATQCQVAQGAIGMAKLFHQRGGDLGGVLVADLLDGKAAGSDIGCFQQAAANRSASAG